jgi:SAM-dependent methyltransferase
MLVSLLNQKIKVNKGEFMYLYDQRFYDYISKGSRRSAEYVVPYMKSIFELDSVLDVGCGAGAWLAVWKENGSKITGLDGDYVNRDTLYIETGEFTAKDLSEPFNLDKKYSIVQSLEVAEHLPKGASENFVECLCAHADIILFSAAPPGQGGDNHVNEQTYEFWRKIFAAQNYVPVDLIRKEFSNNKKVERWYRYNSFVYISKPTFDQLPDTIKSLEITGEIQDNSPMLYKVRKALIRMIPLFIATKIAKVKENICVLKFKLST